MCSVSGLCGSSSEMRRACFFVAGACAAAQTFPSGVAPLLSKFRAVLDGAGGASPGAVETLASSAAAELAAGVARDRNARLLADAASAAATGDVQHLKYVGACVRAVEGCPVDWATGAAGECLPPAGYDGACGATDVSTYSVAQREDFALSCKAAWPCQDCRTDFQGCPSGWGAVGRLCVAPPEYDGICSPVADFSSASDSAKASWSATCAARWQCASK